MFATVIKNLNNEIQVIANNKTYKANIEKITTKVPLFCQISGEIVENTFIADSQEITTDNFLFVNNETVKDHIITSKCDDCLVASEALTIEDAITEIKENLKKSFANCLLHTDLIIHKDKIGENTYYRITGIAATINGETYKQKPGISAHVNKKVARPNFPSDANKKYCRVLSICASLIGGPVILSRHGTISNIAYYGLLIALGLFVSYAFFIYKPKVKKHFVLRFRK